MEQLVARATKRVHMCADGRGGGRGGRLALPLVPAAVPARDRGRRGASWHAQARSLVTSLPGTAKAALPHARRCAVQFSVFVPCATEPIAGILKRTGTEAIFACRMWERAWEGLAPFEGWGGGGGTGPRATFSRLLCVLCFAVLLSCPAVGSQRGVPRQVGSVAIEQGCATRHTKPITAQRRSRPMRACWP